MSAVFYFLAAYGLCFALRNEKINVGFLREIEWGDFFFRRMLDCTFCTGAHCGWIMCLIYMIVEGSPGIIGSLLFLPVWAFASAAFCYAVDTLIEERELAKARHERELHDKE